MEPDRKLYAKVVKVLDTVASKFDFSLNSSIMILVASDICGRVRYCPIRWSRNLEAFDGIYLGAIGHPDVTPGTLEKGILLRLRFELDQYVNLRPVKLYPNVETPIKNKGPEDVDFVVVRGEHGGFLRRARRIFQERNAG